MIRELRTVERLRRLAAPQADHWTPVGREVLDEAHNRVVVADTPARASYLCALHNNILLVCGVVVQLAKKSADRLDMRKEQDNDNPH